MNPKLKHDPREPFISLIVLLPKFAEIPKTQISLVLNHLYDDQFERGLDGYFVESVIPGQQYCIILGGRLLLVHNYAEPYFPRNLGQTNAAVAEQISDGELARRVEKHAAWVSVDHLSGEGSEDERWDIVGCIMAELAPSDGEALLLPGRNTIIDFTEDTRTKLRGQSVLKQLGF